MRTPRPLALRHAGGSAFRRAQIDMMIVPTTFKVKLNLDRFQWLSVKAVDGDGKAVPGRVSNGPDSKYGPFAGYTINASQAEPPIRFTARVSYEGHQYTIQATYESLPDSWEERGLAWERTKQTIAPDPSDDEAIGE